jgi:hypothetical protein
MCMSAMHTHTRARAVRLPQAARLAEHMARFRDKEARRRSAFSQQVRCPKGRNSAVEDQASTHAEQAHFSADLPCTQTIARPRTATRTISPSHESLLFLYPRKVARFLPAELLLAAGLASEPPHCAVSVPPPPAPLLHVTPADLLPLSYLDARLAGSTAAVGGGASLLGSLAGGGGTSHHHPAHHHSHSHSQSHSQSPSASHQVRP